MSEGIEPVVGPRVLQVLPALGEGGAERDTLDLARYLAAQGWAPLLASRGGPGEAALREAGVATFRLPLGSKNPLAIRANIGRLQRLVQEQGVQLIHAHSRAPAWSGWYAARRCGIPFVTTVHGVHRGSGNLLKRRYNAVMARGDRVIAVSEHVAGHVREHYGADRLRVIPRGIDTATFAAAAVARERIEALARRWQVPQGARVVMLPARMARSKGHLLLLDAIAQMPGRDFVCLLVGPVREGSRYGREVARRIEALGLAGAVRLVGGCADMPAALALADVVAVPSIGREAFGRVAIEAQALGRPVVATDVGGLGETLLPGVTGWLVPPEPRALAGALTEALALSDDARAGLALRARRLVQQRFSLARVGESTIAVYRELLEARVPGAPPCG